MAQSSSKTQRPLSPHLQIYKPQLTSGMSIFHRMTGIALAAGLPVFVGWVVFLAGGPKLYPSFINLFHNTIGEILLYGWLFCFFYHFCCGIRHLLWDAGHLLTIRGVYLSGYVALLVAVMGTVSTWLKVNGYFG